jgi:rhodanese-related sulfurtransferase
MMPDMEATYIVYCRSGNRSATAAQMLIDLGYQNIYDMGGIIDWPYETETGQ